MLDYLIKKLSDESVDFTLKKMLLIVIFLLNFLLGVGVFFGILIFTIFWHGATHDCIMVERLETFIQK